MRMRYAAAAVRPLLLCLFTAAAASGGRHVVAQPGEEVSDGLIVHLRPGALFTASNVPAKFLGQSRWRAMGLPNHHRVRVDSPADLAAAGVALAADPAVELVEPDRIRRVAIAAPNDPRFPEQWHLAAIRAREAWQWFPGRYLTAALALGRVRVAVLDTGVDCTHPDFANAGNSSTDTAVGGQLNWARSVAVQQTTINPAVCPWQDDHGHGTAVAGLVVAATNNQTGVAALGGMLEAAVYKVSGASGASTDAILADAIVAATDDGARVITISLSATGYSQSLQEAAAYAWEHNVIVVGAAGNSNSSAPNYPAASDHVVGVGAVDSGGAVASFSNRGNAIDIAAPGVSVLTTTQVSGGRYDPNYALVSGTSMSAPQVAALAGLMVMASPGVAADEVVRRIERSASLDVDGWSSDFGFGRIDAERALTGANWRGSTKGGVTGYATDFEGMPITSATVTLGSSSFTTDSTGLFRLTGIAPGDYTLNMTATGQTTLNVPVTITAGADTPVAVRMGVAYGTLRGTVNAGGTPAAGIVVAAWQQGKQKAVAVTNPSGQYRLFVPAGAYEVRTGGMFQTVGTTPVQTVPSGSIVDAPPVATQNFGRLEGNIRNAFTGPVADAQVLLSQPGGQTFGAVSNSAGDYRTIPGPAGAYQAAVDHPTAGTAPAATVSIATDTTGRLDFVLRTSGQTTTLTPGNASFDALGGSRSAAIVTGSASLPWVATANVPWLSIPSAAAGSGNATLDYRVEPNPDAATRSGRIQVNEAVLTVTQTGATAGVFPNPASVVVAETGGSKSVAITSSGVWVGVSQAAWISLTPPGTGTGNGTLSFTVQPNQSNSARTGQIRVNGATIAVTQSAATITLAPASLTVGPEAASGTLGITVSPAGTAWSAVTGASWIAIAGAASGQGNGILTYQVAANPGTATRTGTITVGGTVFSLTQTGILVFQFTPPNDTFPAAGGARSFTVTGAGAWTATSSVSWVSIVSTAANAVNYSVAANVGLAARTGAILVGSSVFTIAQSGTPSSGLHFVPVQPCRLVDTRENLGQFGRPFLAASETRSFTIPAASCGIPASAMAYALNVTVVPKGRLGFITIFPAGQPQPLVSTLNSIDGRIKANAALVPAGAAGAISVFATDATELVVDIAGYFADPGTSANGLAFYPIAPCRVADTRNPAAALGGPALAANVVRSLPVPGSSCGVPASARAYSINATVIPPAQFGFLTLWANGQPQPFVSTLNAPTGAIVANAAIVPAGANGAINALATGATHLVVDIIGYFAPPGAANAQRFYPVAPCRVLDTRNANGNFGGPILAAGQTRSWPIPSAACGLPAGASAYSLNATVVPPAGLGFLTMWPAGQTQPLVSTLNALDDSIVANAAIVGAGASGAISTFASGQTHLVVDTNGYFAP